MSERFPVDMMEIAFIRRVGLAAEIVDGVTLVPVRAGIKVSAEGLKRKPIVNSSGFFVWLEEPDREAEAIVVDAAETDYESARGEPVAPPRHVRIELAPKPTYAFPTGATAYRGTLRESRYGPPVAIAGAEVRLQWTGDDGWVDAPLASRSAANGDFVATLRLAPKQDPRAHAEGGIAARLRIDRDGRVRTSAEFALVQGRVGAAAQPFIWDDLNP